MKIIILLFIIIIPLQTIAQEKEPVINTDRPGFSDASRTVPKGYFQMENGFLFQTETTGGIRRQLINFNSTLLKYGIIDGLEVRLNQSVLAERLFENNQPSGLGWQNGLAPLVVGVKLNLIEEKGLLPEMAFVTDYTIAKNVGYFQNAKGALRFNLIALHHLNPDWIFTYNIGLSSTLGTNNPTFTYTIKTAYTIKNLSPYFEVYGFSSRVNIPFNYMNGGFSYLLSNTLQLDLHAGVDIIQLFDENILIDQNFISAGLSYMLKIKK